MSLRLTNPGRVPLFTGPGRSPAGGPHGGIVWPASRPLTAPAVTLRAFAPTYAGHLPA
jgi:hypothetical protein